MIGTGIQRLIPRRTDRALFVGQTGSGKTTLARNLLRARRYVVVLDSKGTLDWTPEYRIVRTLRELFDLDVERDARIIMRPSYADMMDGEFLEEFFDYIYRRRNTTVYVDELAAVSTATIFPDALGACIMRGREHGIEVWAGCQRPSRVPLIALSESENVYAFRLKMPDDRKRIQEVCGIDDDEIAALRKRFFLFASQAD